MIPRTKLRPGWEGSDCLYKDNPVRVVERYPNGHKYGPYGEKIPSTRVILRRPDGSTFFVIDPPMTDFTEAPELAAATDVRRQFGRTIVTLPGTAHLTDDLLLDSALKAARETRASIFGWEINRHLETAVAYVHLFTD